MNSKMSQLYTQYDKTNMKIIQPIKTPTLDTDVANKKYVDDQIGNIFDQTLNTTDDVQFNSVTVPAPVSGGDATNKTYVDDQIGNIFDQTLNTTDDVQFNSVTVPAPVSGGDATNKTYVDAQVGNPFDQTLNTTDDVQFNSVTVPAPVSGGDAANKTYVDGQTTELLNTNGWAFYTDAETSPATQTFTDTFTKLQIDGGGATTNTSYLPPIIRGSGDLWDVVNDKITPIAVGDAYDFRLDLTITGESGNPTELQMELDIGGGATPTIVIVDRYIGTGKTTPYSISAGFSIFTLGTFVANGGQIFLKTNTGTATVSARSVLLVRNVNGNI